ncbi:hypothetical protein CIPAW_08G032900 [Carya illinoinensis]|uniref:Dof zinc finger protein n=1 Tax=Carya illinoinensis TaxID=32201 RepID=A0A8T1PPN4_CARIL|nr:hypothetical protein CIPAW_08G032900 [Carya illinoinensis]
MRLQNKKPLHSSLYHCNSTNTKFCYYNNYNFSQPRHFCKSCRRYWTRGGTLRDIPVGSGSRKNAKRSRIVTASTATSQVDPLLAFPFLLPLTPNQSSSVHFGGDGKEQDEMMRIWSEVFWSKR